MRIDIWSDIVCPFCYIGKRRLEKALTAADEDAEVVYHSFQLDPSAPAQPTQPHAVRLGAKYGGGEERGLQMIDQVEAAAAEEGLLFSLRDAQDGNTLDAHRLLHLALAEGGPQLQASVKEELLDGYFTGQRNPADREFLLEVAESAGLSADRVREVLDSREYADDVEADIRQAAGLGVSGVPFFVFDGKYGVSGAQPREVFDQVIEKVRAEAQPVVQMVGGETDEACGPDGCAI